MKMITRTNAEPMSYNTSRGTVSLWKSLWIDRDTSSWGHAITVGDHSRYENYWLSYTNSHSEGKSPYSIHKNLPYSIHKNIF